MELLKCKQCGSDIPNGTKFCHNCGNIVEMIENKQSIQESNLMYCNDCGNKISRSALQCPYCGKPYKQIEKRGRQELIEVKSPELKALSYISIVISLFIPYGVFIPIIWGFVFLLIYASKDGRKVNARYYKILCIECFVSAVVIFAINFFLILFFESNKLL